MDHRPNKAEPRIETAAIPEGSAPQPLAQEPDLQWLFWLCAFVTAMLWLSTVHDFIAQAPELDHANPVTTIYLAILGVYAGSKHLLRRSGVSEADERLIRGEYFVILWVATLAVMAMLQFYPTAHQALPYDFWRILYGVLGIFCGTKAAKAFLPSKPQNPESWTPNGARKNPADRTA